MKWFDKLERKFSKYAINNLIYYVIGMYVIGFIIKSFYPAVFMAYFPLDASKIIHEGQIWRIVTFLFQPPSTNILFLAIALYFYYMIGSVLENVWGSFKFNMYFFVGVILHVIAAIVIYLAWGIVFSFDTYYINMSLFLAFATINPDVQLLLFFFIPIKIKWLAILDGAIFVATIVFGFAYRIIPYNVWYGLVSMGIPALPEYATAALLSLFNFFVFFIITKKPKKKTETQKNFYKNYVNKQDINSDSNDKKKEKKHFSKIAKHKCAVCGITDKDNENETFRFCSKCEGNYEYCSKHLYTHKHIIKDVSESGNNVADFNKHR